MGNNIDINTSIHIVEYMLEYLYKALEINIFFTVE